MRKSWVCFIKQKIQALLPALDRELLSLMWGSRLFYRQWDVGYAVPSKRQWCDTSWPHSGGAKRGRAPIAKRTTCLLLGPGGRETCHSQGEKTFFFLANACLASALVHLHRWLSYAVPHPSLFPFRTQTPTLLSYLVLSLAFP